MNIPNRIESMAESIPGLGGLFIKRRLYLDWSRFTPPGHFYSPVPSKEDIERRARNPLGAETPGLQPGRGAQFSFVKSLSSYYHELPFPHEPKDAIRYYYRNGYYTYADAIFLYSVIRHLRPKRIIEVGSGFSSAVMLDTIDRYLDRKPAVSFVDPYPDRLMKLMQSNDSNNCSVVRHPVQDVDLELFLSLAHGDILFVDSSHVSKAGSDVCFLMFEVLPRLQPGVWVHIHDIFPDFDYPVQSLRDGVAWNEAYLLRAFLLFNREFEIVLHTPDCIDSNRDWFLSSMPLCLNDTGSSIWIRRIRA